MNAKRFLDETPELLGAIVSELAHDIAQEFNLLLSNKIYSEVSIHIGEYAKLKGIDLEQEYGDDWEIEVMESKLGSRMYERVADLFLRNLRDIII